MRYSAMTHPTETRSRTVATQRHLYSAGMGSQRRRFRAPSDGHSVRCLMSAFDPVRTLARRLLHHRSQLHAMLITSELPGPNLGCSRSAIKASLGSRPQWQLWVETGHYSWSLQVGEALSPMVLVKLMCRRLQWIDDRHDPTTVSGGMNPMPGGLFAGAPGWSVQAPAYG